ncbi:KTSC domain-containing protein [Croceibacterium aestuarii]|uniref:KTSC domain-containing protein n=1 Tax=Croceibacterium aestuarii TaxID=3064139 RepID=UPI00272EE410|nr:KTSC domain-containing protein [Croceibacterium sp. D39]
MPSTAIRRYAYRPDAATLDVEFVGGRTYRYHAVPEPVARGLAGARSKGGYFNRYLRDRYAFEHLRGGWEAPDEEADPA